MTKLEALDLFDSYVKRDAAILEVAKLALIELGELTQQNADVVIRKRPTGGVVLVNMSLTVLKAAMTQEVADLQAQYDGWLRYREHIADSLYEMWEPHDTEIVVPVP